VRGRTHRRFYNQVATKIPDGLLFTHRPFFKQLAEKYLMTFFAHHSFFQPLAIPLHCGAPEKLWWPFL